MSSVRQFLIGIAVIPVHVPEPGTSAGDHLVSFFDEAPR
jgi:hypothetical protein